MKPSVRFNRFMTNVPVEMEAFEKTATGDGGFEQTQEIKILK